MRRLALLALPLFLALEASAAPLPVFRTRPVRQVSAAGMVGTWACQWGSVSCTMTLAAGGGYACQWPGADYTGSWGVKAGRLWLTESSNPRSAFSWHSYRLDIDPGTMTGPVGVGAIGIHVSMRRKR